jgi:hypothetical protein
LEETGLEDELFSSFCRSIIGGEVNIEGVEMRKPGFGTRYNERDVIFLLAFGLLKSLSE